MAQFTRSLAAYRDKPETTDVTIHIQPGNGRPGGSTRLHRVILAAASDYFDGVFRGPRQPSYNLDVEDEGAAELLFTWIYDTTVVIPQNKLLLVRSLASKLGIQKYLAKEEEVTTADAQKIILDPRPEWLSLCSLPANFDKVTNLALFGTVSRAVVEGLLVALGDRKLPQNLVRLVNQWEDDNPNEPSLPAQQIVTLRPHLTPDQQRSLVVVGNLPPRIPFATYGLDVAYPHIHDVSRILPYLFPPSEEVLGLTWEALGKYIPHHPSGYYAIRVTNGLPLRLSKIPKMGELLAYLPYGSSLDGFPYSALVEVAKDLGVDISTGIPFNVLVSRIADRLIDLNLVVN